jgi:uncharacterized membrane protein
MTAFWFTIGALLAIFIGLRLLLVYQALRSLTR